VPQTRPSAIFRHVYADDVAEAFIRAAGNPAAFNRTYNVAGQEILSLDDYIRAIATAAGREAKIVAASLEWILLQRSLSDFSAPFVGERFIQDISRAQQDLGYQPTPLEEWLRVTVDWLLRTCHVPGSARSSRRAAEVAAARRWVAYDLMQGSALPSVGESTLGQTAVREKIADFFLRVTSRLPGCRARGVKWLTQCIEAFSWIKRH
jgi:hypothetical protein